MTDDSSYSLQCAVGFSGVLDQDEHALNELFSILIYFLNVIIPVIAKLNFQQPLLQCSVSHDHFI